MHRALVYLLAVVFAVLPYARIASAHSGTSGNYVSTVLSVDPAVPGLAVMVVGRDDQLLLTNGSGKEVVVLGYQNEPYLRFADDGVYANVRSPAYYLNNDRYGVVQLPPTADAMAPPEWTKVAEGNSYAWHDHRIHWMSQSPPPAVQGQLGQRQVIFNWTVPLTVDGPVQVHGQLEWVPTLDASLWFGMGGIVLVLGLVTAMRNLDSVERGCRIASTLAIALAGLACVQAGLLLSGFGARDTSLLEPVTILVSVATVIVAVRAWRSPGVSAARTLAATALGLTVVAGGLHLDLVGNAAVDNHDDVVLPFLVVVQLITGLATVGVALLAARQAGKPALVPQSEEA